MKFPWITLLSCVAAGPLAWYAGRRSVPPEPPAPATVLAAAPALEQIEATAPAKPPVLSEVLALATAAGLEKESVNRQQQLHAAVRLLADATAAEAKFQITT